MLLFTRDAYSAMMRGVRFLTPMLSVTAGVPGGVVNHYSIRASVILYIVTITDVVSTTFSMILTTTQAD